MAQTNPQCVQEGRSTIWCRSPPHSRCVCVCVVVVVVVGRGGGQTVKANYCTAVVLHFCCCLTGWTGSWLQLLCLQGACRHGSLMCVIFLLLSALFLNVHNQIQMQLNAFCNFCLDKKNVLAVHNFVK